MAAQTALGAIVRTRFAMLGRKTAAAAACACLSVPAQAASYYLVVGGLGGQPEYADEFARYTAEISAAARRSVSDESQVVSLIGETATREALREALRRLADELSEADDLTVVLVGHGSHDGETYKFNLPGPDITGAELGELLAAVPAEPQFVVNATSASGAVLEDWKADDRIVVTATRSGAERNAVRFPEYFAAALSADAADTNKDGVVNAREAFDYASRRVADSYESDGRLATEHPQLEGQGAGAFRVARLTEREAETAEIESLLAELDTLEGEVAALRARREELGSEEYLSQLQDLLVEVALVQERIDAERAAASQGADASGDAGGSGDAGDTGDSGDAGDTGDAAGGSAAAEAGGADSGGDDGDAGDGDADDVPVRETL